MAKKNQNKSANYLAYTSIIVVVFGVAFMLYPQEDSVRPLNAPSTRPDQHLIELMLKADKLVDQANTDEAFPIYLTIIQQDTKCDIPEARFNYARGLQQWGHTEKAVRWYEETLTCTSSTQSKTRVNSRLSDVYNNMAHAYKTLENKEKAAEYWEKAAKANGKDPMLWWSLGNVEMERHNQENAIRAFEKAVAEQPNNPKFRYMAAKLKKDEKQLQQALESNDAMEHFVLGMWIQRSDPIAAANHLRRAVQLHGARHPHITSIIYTLGQIYHSQGYPEQEDSLYNQAVQQGVFVSPLQRPLLLLKSLTPGTPFPKEPTVLEKLKPAFDALEANCDVIRQELLGETDFKLYKDNEDLESSGQWRQIVLMRDGAKSVHNWGKYQNTVQVVEPIVRELAADLPKGSVELSIMEPGTHVRPHCGPSNHRLRVHLGLVIPSGSIEMRVAEETTGWEQCKVLVFDDSFEHEVHHNGTARRVVLMIDVWHPHISEKEKEEVRKHFHWKPNRVLTGKVSH